MYYNEDAIIRSYREEIPDVEYILSDLKVDNLLHIASTSKDGNVLQITQFGERIKANLGYIHFKQEQDEREEFVRQKEQLELISLQQTVRKGSWEFYFMMIGAVGGFISFIFVFIQFIVWIINI